MDSDYTYKQMKAADHVPTHLGRGALQLVGHHQDR